MRLRSFGLRLRMTSGRNSGNNFAAAAERKRRGVGRNDFAAPVGSCPSESEDRGGCVLFFRSLYLTENHFSDGKASR